jgi:UDP-N-acetylmuramoyl-tripeptide--D-alanyl-D-alanine ligase
MLSGIDLMNLTKTRILNAALLENKRFKGVSIDSRTCRKDEVFFAIKGTSFNGHDYVEDVFGKGVSAAVVSWKWDGYKNIALTNKSLVFVKDTTKSLGELAGNYRKQFLIPVLAVAGSNGKTTARDMIASVLAKKYNVLRSEQNLNNQYGVPLTLFQLRKQHEFCVLELGTNHFGEIEYLCNIAQPQFGVITNIGKEHLEFFKNLSGVAKAEGELLEYIKGTHGTFFFNVDDSWIRTIVSRSKFNHYFSYGSLRNSEVRGKIVGFDKFYPIISVTRYGVFPKGLLGAAGRSEKSMGFKTTLSSIGTQSFSSAICAAAIGFYFEVPTAQIKSALSKFHVVTKRRNELIERNGISIIDDSYNSNPDSAAAALENLKRYKIKGSIHIVLSDMLELGKSSAKEHRRIGSMISNMGFDNLYTFGPESYATHLAAKKVKNNFYFSDKRTLIELLKLRVKKGDLLFVKGSHGMRMDEVVDSACRAERSVRRTPSEKNPRLLEDGIPRWRSESLIIDN